MKPYYQDSHVAIFVGDCREILPQLDAASVQCCVTSPPYFGLRDYGGTAQIGLEATPAAYVAALRDVFDSVRRVLREDGTLWCNLGDSYAGSWGNYGGQNRGNGTQRTITNGSQAPQQAYEGLENWKPPTANRIPGIKEKDLIGIPWRVAFALQEAGWWLRSDIIWHKPACMPESVTDRPTRAHEYIFLLAKAARYWYDADAIAEPAIKTDVRETTFKRSGTKRNGIAIPGHADVPHREDRPDTFPTGTRNKRTVWTVNTQPFAGAHFATFPPKLIEPCILAGCPAKVCAVCGAPWERVVERTPMIIRRSDRRDAMGEYGRTQTSGTMLEPATSITLGFQPTCLHNADTIPGTVIDPFAGSGTTGMVAKSLGRRAILIEQNEAYAAMAADRIESVTMPLPLEAL